MVFARTSKAASRLSEAVRSRSFGKTYMCIVQGKPEKRSATLTHYIRKDAKRNQVAVFDAPTTEAKEAVLDYVVTASSRDHSLVAVKLRTGRPHQIRAQMARVGCPLVGDLKYGADKRKETADIMLWSTSVSFPHPVTKEPITFRSLPEGGPVWSWWTPEELETASRIMLEADS